MPNLSREQIASRARRCQILTLAAIAIAAGSVIAAMPDPAEQVMTVAEECDLREAMTETPEQYAYCDDYYHRLPVIECDTDSDCMEKNPALARWTNYEAY